MAPSAAAVRNRDAAESEPVVNLAPPAKRLRFASPVDDRDASDDNDGGEIPHHPLRIKPSGNALTASYNLRDTSTGIFAMLPDELLMQILGLLDAQSLVNLGGTSKGMYGFCRAEELWRPLVTESSASGESVEWLGTWRRTFLKIPEQYESKIMLPDFFSDALYRPFHMSQVSLKPYTSKIPPRNAILSLPTLTAEEFEESYVGTPFILTEPVKEWSGFGQWTLGFLLSKYPDIRFQAESVSWSLRDYAQYMQNQSDESPLYLFDKSFVENTAGEMEKGFSPPGCFGKDYFEVLGAQRPDHRWMILGPKRSGSTFHKDPNATSAWNAVIFGKKYWIMFPPDSPPPGVFVSEDQSEVTSPLSIAEWMVTFHKEARKAPGCIEGICSAGEILHVPSGWWHLVVNLEDSLALTQNFIPRKKIPAALSFLSDQSCSVSGFDMAKVPDPYALFVERMREAFPDELEEAMEVVESKKRSKWDELVGKDSDSAGFSFGFGGGDNSDDDG